ncbi:galactosyltransferase-related protein [Saccharothrix sp.]|uniref:galactosyltransferase-related protein n=1 Tax=Saccharothrix sp. TaxID=1873460 RepID=UPI00281200F4|nr:galactosyltransferase-related protein [Saccharothrix sp.]
MPVLEAFPDPADFALSWMIGTTGNMSALREQVIEVGLLDETFTRWGLEDTDLCYRLVQSGARMAVREATLNHHQVPPPAAKGLEWLVNSRRFSHKVDSIEPALYRLLSTHQIDVRTAHAVARSARPSPDPVKPPRLPTYATATKPCPPPVVDHITPLWFACGDTPEARPHDRGPGF